MRPMPLVKSVMLLLSFGTGALRAEPPSTPVPRLEFVTATMNLGPGRELPPGRKPAPPVVTGVIRASGLDPRRSNFRITVRIEGSGDGKSAAHRLAVTGWNAHDPANPAQIRFTAPWPASVPFEGCTLRVDYVRRKTRLSVQGPVQVFMLPGRPPSGHRQPEQQER